MKKTLSLLVILLMISFSATASNADEIYGKQDNAIKSNFENIYGSSFGTLVQKNLMDPYYVDNNAANNEIQKLQENNISINSDISKDNEEIVQLTLKIKETNQIIIKINELLESVTLTSGNFYNLSKTLNDTDMRNQLQASIDENRQQKYDLTNKKYELIGSIENMYNEVAIVEKNIIINNLYIKQNNYRIDFLNQCINLSENDTNSLNVAIKKSSSLQQEVENLLASISQG